MQSADNYPPEKLIGKKVVFKKDEEHATCWHQQVGLTGGIVLRKAKTLAQKAEMVAGEVEFPEELLSMEPEPPKVWVRADPCPAFARGCETAVELGCLFVIENEVK